VRSPWFFAAQLVPLVLVLAAWRSGRRAEPSDVRRRTASSKAVLAPLHDAVGEPRAFSHQLAAAVRTHLAELCNEPQLRNGSPATLQRAVESAGTPRATAAALADLLDALDRARFAKDEAAPDPKASLKRAEQLLDAVHSARSRGTAARTASLVVLGLGMCAAAAGASQVQKPRMASITAVSAQTDSFHRGVQLMLRSRFTAAASEFEQYLTANTQDANAWYNAGNALFFAAQPGQAVRAWMRAVRVMPRHAEARSNLAIVAPAALPLLPPGYSLRGTEAGILLAALWWVLAAHAAFLLRKRRRPSLVSVILLFVMALVLFGGLASRSASEVAVTTAATPVHSDPVLKAEPVEELPAATPVPIMARRPGWLRVRTPNGRDGWIEAVNLAEV
jgi:tetratricopeptide (TPR) repeat protein